MYRHEEARRSYEQAIQLEPEEATYYFNFGLLLEELGQKQEAGNLYQRASQLRLPVERTALLEAIGPSWEDMATVSLRAPTLLKS